MEDPSLKVIIDKRQECIAVGCRSWYCPCCMVGKALALRADLCTAVETFGGVMMLTLTIDPKIFKDPEKELAYVQKKRCVAKLVAKLRQHPRCKLYSDRFFCIREFHQDGRVHYHVLLDALYVPFDAVRDAWGHFEPKGYKRPEGDNSPRFGSVRFTKKPFADRLHAARYVTKYLTKTPEEGFPAWVMARKKRLQRYTVSHEFWASCGVERGKQDPSMYEAEAKHDDECEPDCFCAKCCDDPNAETLLALMPPDPSIADRVEKCGTVCVILEIEEAMTPDGQEIYTRRRYLGVLPKTAAEVAEQLSATITLGAKRFELRPGEAEALLGEADDAVEEEPGDKWDQFLRELDNGGRRPTGHQQSLADRVHYDGDHGFHRRTAATRTYSRRRHESREPGGDYRPSEIF
jgi:hypothetical protein